MKILANAYRGVGLSSLAVDVPFPESDAKAVKALLQQCPVSKITPLIDNHALASQAGVASVVAKDERARMGLGSFKALGAAYVIAQDAVATGADDLSNALSGVTYITASAGNHGMSVAAGSRIFGANAAIYIAETVPESFEARLREKEAKVVRAGADYEASMKAAQEAASANNWRLLSDSSWDNYYDRPHRLMEGYLKIMDEVSEQISAAPSHIFLQAGVGGFAGAMASFIRAHWGDDPIIVVVEPEHAPALIESVKAGKCVVTQGPVSSMGRLDCKEPSLIALAGLARDADFFVTITEDEASSAIETLHEEGLETTTSGGAGLAGFIASKDKQNTLHINGESRVLCFITEGPDT